MVSSKVLGVRLVYPESYRYRPASLLPVPTDIDPKSGWAADCATWKHCTWVSGWRLWTICGMLTLSAMVQGVCFVHPEPQRYCTALMLPVPAS